MLAMHDYVPIPVSRAVYERLQKAAVPLVDTPSSIIERLLDHWEVNSPQNKQAAPISAPSVQLWRSPRGDILPVGTQLKAHYLGKTYDAVIEPRGIRFNGELFDAPSAAAVAAKKLTGKTGHAA